MTLREGFPGSEIRKKLTHPDLLAGGALAAAALTTGVVSTSGRQRAPNPPETENQLPAKGWYEAVVPDTLALDVILRDLCQLRSDRFGSRRAWKTGGRGVMRRDLAVSSSPPWMW
jgi:hypothetical protein